VAAREPILDRRLAIEQPVHRAVEVVLVCALDRQLRAQRGARERARHLKLRAGREHPLADHRQHEVAFPRWRPVDQPRQLQPPGHREHRRDVARRHRALDLKRLTLLDVALAAQKAADQPDQLLRQVRQVRERLLLDLAALAIAAPQQRRRVLAIPPPNDICDHVHRARRPRSSTHHATVPAPPDR
jgi:hypothetical protein